MTPDRIVVLSRINGFMVLPLFLARRVVSTVAGLEEAKNLAGKSPPPDSDSCKGDDISLRKLYGFV